MAFLNKEGLEHLWDNIIYKLSEKADKEYVDNAVANAGGVSSWNDLTDKPFGEEIFEPIEWDGNVEGHETVSLSGGYQNVLISDRFLEIDDIVGSTITIVDGATGTREILVEKHMLTTYSEEGYTAVLAENNIIVTSISEQYVQADSWYPKAGTYALYYNVEPYYVSKISFPSKIKQIDSKFIPEEPERVISWNDLTDKPFGDETFGPVTFDGNTEGKDIIQLARTNYIKISDEFLPSDQAMGAAVTFTNKNDGTVESDTITTMHPASDIFGFQDTQSYVAYCNFSGTVAPAIIGINSDEEYGGYAITKGVYINVRVKNSYYVSEITSPSVIKTLDEKYIPDTIARVSDIQTAIGNAIGGSY